MAMPALKFQPESPVEERVAILEANIEHIRSDISDMKTDIRRLNVKLDGNDQRHTTKIDSVGQKLAAKIDGVEQRLTAKIDSVDQKLTTRMDTLKDALANHALSVEKAFSALKVGRALDRIWWLLMSAALLGIMARAFKWI
jgi:gas vesicle protein